MGVSSPSLQTLTHGNSRDIIGLRSLPQVISRRISAFAPSDRAQHHNKFALKQLANLTASTTSPGPGHCYQRRTPAHLSRGSLLAIVYVIGQ